MFALWPAASALSSASSSPGVSLSWTAYAPCCWGGTAKETRFMAAAEALLGLSQAPAEQENGITPRAWG